MLMKLLRTRFNENSFISYWVATWGRTDTANLVGTIHNRTTTVYKYRMWVEYCEVRGGGDSVSTDEKFEKNSTFRSCHLTLVGE
jgi:hypothetical protein